jgi:hypothetical protein
VNGETGDRRPDPPDRGPQWAFRPSKLPRARAFYWSMEQQKRTSTPGYRGVVDCATLYLCRQGDRWAVVFESPRIRAVVPLRYTGRDPYDAHSELLACASRACPDAAIASTDGARASADYEWRLDVRGVEAHPGDLGIALHRALSAEAARTPRSTPHRIGRRCHWGLSPAVSGRPRTF